MTPSPSPAAVAAATALDPTALAILSIFGGAALTVIAGFIGAWIQSRREHVRWVRERRFDAYTAADAVLTRMEGIERRIAMATDPIEREALARRLDDISRDDMPDPISRLNLLGPAAVVAAKEAYQAAKDDDARATAAKGFVRAMRAALDVRD